MRKKEKFLNNFLNDLATNHRRKTERRTKSSVIFDSKNLKMDLHNTGSGTYIMILSGTAFAYRNRIAISHEFSSDI